MTRRIRVGIDTGGTFTDLVGFDDDGEGFVYGKQASTPDMPARAVANVLNEVDAGKQSVASIVVAASVATIAVLLFL